MELTIGEVASRAGIATSAVRYYESLGLIEAHRTAGNQRRYARSTLRRIAFIRVAQQVGVSLSRIQEALASLPGERTPTRQDWERLSQEWRTELEERIGLLERLRDGLSSCIGCGCLSLDRCGLYNPQDVLGGTGSGARILIDRASVEDHPVPPAAAPDAVPPAPRRPPGPARR